MAACHHLYRYFLSYHPSYYFTERKLLKKPTPPFFLLLLECQTLHYNTNRIPSNGFSQKSHHSPGLFFATPEGHGLKHSPVCQGLGHVEENTKCRHTKYKEGLFGFVFYKQKSHSVYNFCKFCLEPCTELVTEEQDETSNMTEDDILLAPFVNHAVTTTISSISKDMKKLLSFFFS